MPHKRMVFFFFAERKGGDIELVGVCVGVWGRTATKPQPKLKKKDKYEKMASVVLATLYALIPGCFRWYNGDNFFGESGGGSSSSMIIINERPIAILNVLVCIPVVTFLNLKLFQMCSDYHHQLLQLQVRGCVCVYVGVFLKRRPSPFPFLLFLKSKPGDKGTVPFYPKVSISKTIEMERGTVFCFFFWF